MDPLEQFIVELSSQESIDQARFDRFQRQFAKKCGLPFFTSDKLLRVYHKLVDGQRIKRNPSLESVLQLKSTRSQSGIVVITVLTKPFPCPGSCLYCPTEKDVPKSYFSTEPAVMRAITHKYNPYDQTTARLKALKAVGHITDKVNIRIVGATWSAYPKSYQTWFIKRIFEAANTNYVIPAKAGILKKISDQVRDDSANNLVALQKQNETAKHRIVEISIETRQDYINPAEIRRLRKLGVTKVELGIQSIDDNILKLNNRGNTDQATINATKMLKDAGFKVSYQMMLNLFGSSAGSDLDTFDRLFSDPAYKPDHMKIYPLALVKEANIYQRYLDGTFYPYSKDDLVNILLKIKVKIPRYCRIERVIRDIPSGHIVKGGAKVSNLRQVVAEEMKKAGVSCQCIRCREIKGDFDETKEWKMFREDYDASGGKEIFLSIENPERTKLCSILRLRIPGILSSRPIANPPEGGSSEARDPITARKDAVFQVLADAALVREMHTYGPQLELGHKSEKAAQHQGFGTKLLAEAEKIARAEYGKQKMAIIAGVGVREYFRKFRYELRDTYMIKKL